MTHPVTHATDTLVDAPNHAGDTQLRALIGDAREAVRQRDELVSEVQRLQRALEDARSRGGRGAGTASAREVMELREALGAREGEVRRLKEASVSREWALAEARGKMDALKGQLSALEGRLVNRERGASDAESRAASAVGELQGERRRAEEARAQLALVVEEVIKTRAALEERTAERDALSARVDECERAETAALGALASEKTAWEELQRAHVAHVSELEARYGARIAALESTLTARVNECEVALASRVNELTTAHAAQVKELTTAHAAQVKELTTAHAAQVSELTTAHDERVEELTRGHGARVEELSRLHGGAVDELTRAHERALAKQRAEHEKALADAQCAVRSEERARADAELERVIDEIGAGNAQLADTLSDVETKLATEQGRRVGALFAASERVSAAKREHERSLTLASEAHASTLASLAALGRERESLARRADELVHRLAEANASLQETASQRDVSQKRVDEMSRRLAEARRRASEEGVRHGEERARLGRVVGEVLAAALAQGAQLSAQRRGRKSAEAFDLDEAVSELSSRLPDAISDEIWAAREALSAKLGVGSVVLAEGAADARVGAAETN